MESYGESVIPKLTSNNSNPPIIVSASSYYQSDLPYKAVDGIDTYSGSDRPFWYQITNTNSWWKIDFGEDNIKAIERIMLKALLVAAGKYSIKNWQLLASNDDVNYIKLSSGIHPNNGNEVYYDVLNEQGYRFYKILIVDSYYDTTHTGILELEMYGYEVKFDYLIKSDNRYYTYQNNEFIEVEPTIENFKNNVYLSQLITPTNKVILTMEGGEVLGDGKIYRKDIDINKYGEIEKVR